MEKKLTFGEAVKDRLEKTGWYIWRYRKIYIVLISLIALFEAYMIVNALVMGRYETTKQILYLAAYCVLFVGSLATGIIMLFFRKKENSPFLLSILVHIYVIFIVVWSTLISCADISYGKYPIVYLTILMAIGGLVAIHPAVFIILFLVSSPFIVYYSVLYKDSISYYSSGGLFNIVVFLIMAFVLAFRMYYVTIHESKFKDVLRKTTMTDPLTGLGNERKYFGLIDKIDGMYEHYAVAMIDLNGLKATNDKYGHRYGCHLVVKCGQMLPTIFPNSHLFHTGGDEYIAIIVEDDYDELDIVLKRFSELLSCTPIEFEGETLILSAAIGVAKKGSGEVYNEVVQRADDLMYANKKTIKEKYKIESRIE